jgi:hypothetical protein
VTVPARLLRLAIAAELCLERDLGALRRIDETTAALRKEAEALRSTGAEGRDLIAMRGDAARLAGSWEELRDRRLAELERRLAGLAALREEARGAVARSSGRVAAVRKLRKTASS